MNSRPVLQLVEASFPDDPALDAALARALLERVAAGSVPDTLRVGAGGRAVAFGKQDVVAPGYAAAVRAARAAGFAPVQRLAGGRAAVFHEGTLVVGHALRDPDPRPSIGERFERAAAVIAAALRKLGVDARVGEVPGEYCPGGHSVNAAGRRKLMGLAQRVVKDGAYVGGVIVVDRPELVNGVLAPVYSALGLDWDPEATGAVAGELPGGVGLEDVREAVLGEYALRYELRESELDPATLELARALAPEHSAPAG